MNTHQQLMKLNMKVKIKLLNPKCTPEIHGDWIDLKSSIDCIINPPIVQNKSVKFYKHLIPLGICIKLPKGFEGKILPRSSTFKTYGIIVNNSMGVIDNSYAGEEDEWKFPALFIESGYINEGDRICQFRIDLTQNAPWYIKLQWLFSKKVEIEYVDYLTEPSRGGLGHTGR